MSTANFEAIDKDVHTSSVEEAMELCVSTDWKEAAESRSGRKSCILKCEKLYGTVSKPDLLKGFASVELV